jgi:hypothetical protein
VQPERLGWAGGAIAVAGPPFVAAVLIPLRGEMRSANVALVLVLVVLVAAIVGGRRGGVIAAVTAALSFDFLYTQPYYSLRIDTRDDIVTTLLLLGVGIVSGELVLRARRSRRAATTSRREMQRMRRIAKVGAGSEPPGRLIEEVRKELCSLFDVASCWFEPPPFPTTMPRLRHGRVAIPSQDPESAALDPTPSRLVELPIYAEGVPKGRFVLEFAQPTTGINLPVDARATALALADQLGVALGRRPPTS